MRRLLVCALMAACSSGATSSSGSSGSAPDAGMAAAAGDLAPAGAEISAPPYGADAVSVRLKRSISVRFLPDRDAKSLGTIAENTRTGWRRAAAGAGCDRWIEIEPRGWICDKYLEPSRKPAAGMEFPQLEEGEIVPGEYGRVTAQGARTFASAQDATRGKLGRRLAGAVTVRKMEDVTVRGHAYWKTSSGELIPATRIAPHKPSTFGGVIDPVLPMAWAQSRKDLSAKLPVRSGPEDNAPIVAQLLPRTVGAILAERPGGAEIAEGWLRRADVHVARPIEPPDEVGLDERWIDVDLDEQVLVAYQGRRPVYTTLISTGKPKYPTPEGIYRIWLKYAETDMNGQMGDEQPYSVATVPWTMFFARDLGFHTAYWHDRFGEPRSHGCVNLAPRDARWLYFWAAPDVPSGWSMVQGIVERPGSLVRVHSSKVPVPDHRGYARYVAAPSPATE